MLEASGTLFREVLKSNKNLRLQIGKVPTEFFNELSIVFENGIIQSSKNKSLAIDLRLAQLRIVGLEKSNKDLWTQRFGPVA